MILDGVISRYPLVTDFFDVISANDLVVTGTGTPVFDNGLVFDAINEVVVSKTDGIEANVDWTISFWFYKSTAEAQVAQQKSMVSCCDAYNIYADNDPTLNLNMFYLDKDYVGSISDATAVGSYNSFGSYYAVNLDTWNNYIITYNATAQTLYFYVNGILKNTLNIAFDLGTYPFYIGSQGLGNFSTKAISGKFLELLFYNRTVTEREALLLYEVGYNNPDYSLICGIPAPDLAPGTFTEFKNVTFTCATAGAQMYYTTNGNDPTVIYDDYNSLYRIIYNDYGLQDYIVISDPFLIKIYATKPGYNDSEIYTGNYDYDTISISGDVSLSPASGTILDTDLITVNLTDGTDVARMMIDVDPRYASGGSYTYLDGETFSLAGFTSPVALYIVARGESKLSGALTTEVYIVDIFIADVTVTNIDVQHFSKDLKIYLNCATANVNIYYTLDGTTPDETSTLYEGYILLNTLPLTTPLTVKAIAYLA